MKDISTGKEIFLTINYSYIEKVATDSVVALTRMERKA